MVERPGSHRVIPWLAAAMIGVALGIWMLVAPAPFVGSTRRPPRSITEVRALGVLIIVFVTLAAARVVTNRTRQPPLSG